MNHDQDLSKTTQLPTSEQTPAPLGTSHSGKFHRRRIADSLRPTDITPQTFTSIPEVLTTQHIESILTSLAEGRADRKSLLETVRTANRYMLDTHGTIGVYLDGRSVKQTNENEQGYVIMRDGWGGDVVEGTRMIPPLLQEGKQIVVFSSDPTCIGKRGNDAITHVQIPDEVIPFQFYPFHLPGYTNLIEFLHAQQTQDMALFAPLNTRDPFFFRLERSNGQVTFDSRSKQTIDNLQRAVNGKMKDDFSGIPMRLWSLLCHQLQAMQAGGYLLGLDTTAWTEFPPAYLNPPIASRAVAREYAHRFAPDAANLLFHIGTATNDPIKEKKAYPVERWKDVLDRIAHNRPELVGTVIFFEPINPAQAAQTRDIALYAHQLFGDEKVILLPMRNDWNWGAFFAFLDELRDKGILVCTDSAPAHAAGAIGTPFVEVGNTVVEQRFYAPQSASSGGMIILPTRGTDAAHVEPEDVAQTIAAVTANLFRN